MCIKRWDRTRFYIILSDDSAMMHQKHGVLMMHQKHGVLLFASRTEANNYLKKPWF